jgi:hypothetical protein
MGAETLAPAAKRDILMGKVSPPQPVLILRGGNDRCVSNATLGTLGDVAASI